MAEDSDLEKTEPASPRRIEKAREEGQIARSRELNTFLLLAVGVAILWLGGGYFYHNLRLLMRNSMWFDPRVGTDTDAMVIVAVEGAFHALLSMSPLFAALVVVAVLASVALGGMMFSLKSLEPKFERLSPLKGITRMFSAQTVIELVKTLAKAGLIGSVSVYVIWAQREQMTSLMFVEPREALAVGIGLVARCCALIVASLLIIVLIDVPWQLWSYYKKLRMSRQDVKEEHKESEGDPHVKGRIRQQQRAMARSRMMAQVPTADVVITNPTHYAVALRYEQQSGGAPKVVAKGSGFIALRIRELAAEHRIPQLEAAPLARALYFNVELKQEIPDQLYSAVAEVLAWVYQLNNWQRQGGARPAQPDHLTVPPGMDQRVTANRTTSNHE